VNFLAHHWLAGEDENMQLGAWLGDFIKGSHRLNAYTAEVQKGIHLHRSIDSFVDGHAITLELKSTFPAPYRRYSGIILDLMADHFLARDWLRHHHRPLRDIEQLAFSLLHRRRALLPERLIRFIAYARPRLLLSGYRKRSVIVESLAGISTRLKHDNPLSDTADLIEENFTRWEPGLNELLADTRDFAGLPG